MPAWRPKIAEPWPGAIRPKHLAHLLYSGHTRTLLHGWASLHHHLAVNQGSCDLSEAERTRGAAPPFGPGLVIPSAITGEHHGILQ